MAIIKVSISGIKEITVEHLPTVCGKMQSGIFDNPTIFDGELPFTTLQVTAFITNFNKYHLAFQMGGLQQRIPYETARTGIIGCMLEFAPYVSKIANGDESILALTGLPLTGKGNLSKQYILAGKIPTVVEGTPGITGTINCTCDPFGPNATYIAILVPGGPLPNGFGSYLNGHVILPPNTIQYYLCLNGKRNISFENLPTTETYWLYYLVMSGGYVSGYSVGKKVSPGV